ncbi:MAG: hypothetical protein DKM50_08430 [Candidatus Margulisiibacteriota bacterium]|nr:MAG: hypothetical protein A2X43_12020 [Candidatus Margulisbacteria bacterium GWD2_39_127]PZM79476.1 MAG: hypothetical protein DKM50_08430 [Candidatus Margulisiibacteriota bacterium]HAR63854.1 hypothetical protein [Candidatus Margulisiibacteriota bacterium]HCT85909.1 hypothetical protein [Candidatus Margulisiibacteriota bacterium]
MIIFSGKIIGGYSGLILKYIKQFLNFEEITGLEVNRQHPLIVKLRPDVFLRIQLQGEKHIMTIIGSNGEYRDTTKFEVQQNQVIRLGRDPYSTNFLIGDYHTQIKDKGISNIHCEILRNGDDIYTVRDMGSTNGTIITGSGHVPVIRSTNVPEGSEFTLRLNKPLAFSFLNYVFEKPKYVKIVADERFIGYEEKFYKLSTYYGDSRSGNTGIIGSVYCPELCDDFEIILRENILMVKLKKPAMLIPANVYDSFSYDTVDV